MAAEQGDYELSERSKAALDRYARVRARNDRAAVVAIIALLAFCGIAYATNGYRMDGLVWSLAAATVAVILVALLRVLYQYLFWWDLLRDPWAD